VARPRACATPRTDRPEEPFGSGAESTRSLPVRVDVIVRVHVDVRVRLRLRVPVPVPAHVPVPPPASLPELGPDSLAASSAVLDPTAGHHAMLRMFRPRGSARPLAGGLRDELSALRRPEPSDCDELLALPSSAPAWSSAARRPTGVWCAHAGTGSRLRSPAGRPARLRSFAGRPARLRSSAGRPARLRSSAGRPAGLRSSAGRSSARLWPSARGPAPRLWSPAGRPARLRSSAGRPARFRLGSGLWPTARRARRSATEHSAPGARGSTPGLWRRCSPAGLRPASGTAGVRPSARR
jgi:hypothetical protein